MSSFGPGRYNAFVCVDWMLDYDIPASNSSSSGNGITSGGPSGGISTGMIEEYGAYINSFPTMGSVQLSQLYGGESFFPIPSHFLPSPSSSCSPHLFAPPLTRKQQVQNKASSSHFVRTFSLSTSSTPNFPEIIVEFLSLIQAISSPAWAISRSAQIPFTIASPPSSRNGRMISGSKMHYSAALDQSSSV